LERPKDGVLGCSFGRSASADDLIVVVDSDGRRVVKGAEVRYAPVLPQNCVIVPTAAVRLPDDLTSFVDVCRIASVGAGRKTERPYGSVLKS
jgi:hypothetical protein